MPNHNVSFVKSSETIKNYVMNVDIDDDKMDTDKKYPIEQNPINGLVALVKTQHPRGRTKKPLGIAFSS